MDNLQDVWECNLKKFNSSTVQGVFKFYIFSDVNNL